MMPASPAAEEQPQVAESATDIIKEQLSHAFEVERCLTAALERMSGWLVKAKRSAGEAHQSLYADKLRTVRKVQEERIISLWDSVRVASYLRIARDIADSIFRKIEANFALDGASKGSTRLHKYDPAVVKGDLADLERVVRDLGAVPCPHQGGFVKELFLLDLDDVFGQAHDCSDFQELRREAAEMRDALNRACVLDAVRTGLRHRIDDFLWRLVADLRRPFDAGDFEQKAPLVMPRICQNRGLDARRGDVLACFRAYLVYEAASLGDLYEEAPDTILDCLGSAEVLCACCGLCGEDDVKERKRETVEQLTQAFWQQRGFGDDIQEVGALEQTVRALEAQLSGSSDNQEKAEVGERLGAARAALSAARCALKEQQGALRGELQRVVRLTKLVMEQLRATFSEEHDALVLKSLQLQSAHYSHTVRRAMEAFMLQVGQEVSRQLAPATSCAPRGN